MPERRFLHRSRVSTGPEPSSLEDIVLGGRAVWVVDSAAIGSRRLPRSPDTAFHALPIPRCGIEGGLIDSTAVVHHWTHAARASTRRAILFGIGHRRRRRDTPLLLVTRPGRPLIEASLEVAPSVILWRIPSQPYVRAPVSWIVRWRRCSRARQRLRWKAACRRRSPGLRRVRGLSRWPLSNPCRPERRRTGGWRW